MSALKRQARFYDHNNTGSLPAAYDEILLVAIFLLLAVGLLMVTSSSVSIAHATHEDQLYYFYRQGFALTIGIFFGLICLYIPMHFWQYLSMPLLGMGALLLVLVFFPGIGREVNGSLRWLDIGVSFQASEPAKFCLIVYMANYIARRGYALRTRFIGFLIPNVVMAVLAILLLKASDLGTCVVLFSTLMGMLFIGGVPVIRLLTWSCAAAGAGLCAIVFSPYRMGKLMSFMDPWQDPWGIGFQLTQALIAFGRGEWFGLGIGNSIQKLFYLPEAHTDFVYAVLAEEFGFLGSVLIIALFLIIVWRIFSIAYSAHLKEKEFAACYAYGTGLLLGIQAFVHIAVNIGLVPTKGLTLPLISYGGSSMVVTCVLLGVLLRVDQENRMPDDVTSEGGKETWSDTLDDTITAVSTAGGTWHEESTRWR